MYLSKNDIEKLVNNYRNEIIKLTSDLIKIPSENMPPEGNELDAQNHLMNYFSKNNIKYDSFTPNEVKELRKHPAYWPGRIYDSRPNVVAKIGGTGGGKSVIFSGHMDTVTRYPDEWEISKPFSGDIKEGHIYGRGSQDMKSGLASTAILMKIIKDNNIKVKGDIFFESVVDEENGGSNGTLACRLRGGYNTDVAIISEPTELQVCNGNLGNKQYKVIIKKKNDKNPIYDLAKLILLMPDYKDKLNRVLKCQLLKEKIVKLKNSISESMVLYNIAAGDFLSGGNDGIPQNAWFSIVLSSPIDFDENKLDSHIKNFISSAFKVSNSNLGENLPEIISLSRYIYPSYTSPDHPIFKLFLDSYLFKENCKTQILGAGTDAFIFTKYFNIPTVLFGPRGGNAHGRDEYVEIESLIDHCKVILTTVLKWCN